MDVTEPAAPTRCAWPGADPLYLAYHDDEWGVPVRDDRLLFEKLTLDGFQAGLSWITILRKRDGFRRAFEGFDPERIALWGDAEVQRLLGDAGIVRHRGKIEATLGNARAWVALRAGGETFSDFLWSFVGGETLVNHWRARDARPSSTPESVAMSKALKKRGFRFCGPTICYAFMQAVGMVNDHLVECYRHAEVGR